MKRVNMNIKKVINFSLIFFVCGLLAGCFSPWTGEESGSGSLTISLGGGNSRALLNWDNTVDSDSLDHTITVKDSAGAEHIITIPSSVLPPRTANFPSLPLGNCDIKIEGKDGSGVLQALGSQSITIQAGSNGPVDIIMGPPSPGVLGMRISSAIPSSPVKITPIVNGTYKETEYSFTVEVFGFINDTDANSVTLNVPGVNGLVFSGHTVTGNASGGTKTFTVLAQYNGTASPRSGITDSISIDLSSTPPLPVGHTYAGGSRTIAVEIYDGKSAACAIPVKQENVSHFGVYADSGGGGNSNYYILEDDVTLTNWTPIGDLTNPFKGSFDGQGNTITLNSSSITPKTVGLVTFIGIFAVLHNDSSSPGLAKNLRLTGSIAGTYSNDTIEAGALTADNRNGIIENVFSDVDIDVTNTGIDMYVGGIAGSNSGATFGNITNCYVTGDVKGTSSTRVHAGGITGDHNGNAIDYCWSEGNIITSNNNNSASSVGGIVGFMGNNISRCVALNASLVMNSGGSSTRVGRMAGFQGAGSVSDCFGLDMMQPYPGTWSSAPVGGVHGGNVTNSNSGGAGDQTWWETFVTGPGWTFATDKATATANALGGSGSPWYWGAGNRPRLWFE